MIRISTIFIAICMVLVAASLGLVLHAVAGFSGTESAIVALTALTFLILYNAVSMRLRDRSERGELRPYPDRPRRDQRAWRASQATGHLGGEPRGSAGFGRGDRAPGPVGPTTFRTA
jgi:hypothetical protein